MDKKPKNSSNLSNIGKDELEHGLEQTSVQVENNPKRWTPQIGERIFWVNANFTVSQDRFNDFETQRKRRAVGNEFKTGKEAQQAAEAVRETLEKFHEKIAKK
ncbi:MAG: hypothetical protein K2H18_02355 [Muribaculaceae bacterium]|nr:hypothetical protein [Muribaculaceae bacterium]